MIFFDIFLIINLIELLRAFLARHLLTKHFHTFSLKEFLPYHYMRVNKIEKKIFTEHKKLQGTSEVDTKVKYVKLARGLPTFGVHFFLVKVSSKV